MKILSKSARLYCQCAFVFLAANLAAQRQLVPEKAAPRESVPVQPAFAEEGDAPDGSAGAPQDPVRAAPEGPARLLVEPMATDSSTVSTIVSSSGRRLHSTAAEVRGLRSIRVPGGDGMVHLWTEVSALGEQAYYAHSVRGALQGRVRMTGNLVRLADVTFDPLVGVPAAPALLKAGRDNELFLVQFVCPPLPEMRQFVEQSGGVVHRYLTDHTFVVEASGAAVRAMAADPIVRWTGAYEPAWRIPQALHAQLLAEPTGHAERWSIMTCERGAAQQAALAELVRGWGSKVHVMTPEGFRMEATLDRAQLLQLLQRPEVQYVDPWGGPGEIDMNVVRNVGGADFIESTLGYTGQGVRGEIFDTELRTTHQEWSPAPIIHSAGTASGSLHGTSCFSINFADGTSANARGMLPDGTGVFFRYSESSQFGGATSRYTINQELLDPTGPYQCVFQTSSVGSARTTSYTTISAEVDDYLFLHQVLSTQSQSNAGTQQSRPQAWAKNIVSVGGVYHFGTASLADDRWNSGASIGPAADGRIKPDLCFFYDGIFSARGSGDTAYTNFGGTSAATPETSGHFGIMHQMWHERIWDGHGGNTTVFASRPKMATAKALMINHAQRYTWTSGGPNADIDRYKQGWGLPNLQNLYDDRDDVLIVNETDPVAPLSTNRYRVSVSAGTPELRVTLCYVDPMGTVGAAQARINDLSLRVTSPSGTVYWGNNGLTAGNTSTSGGISNTIDQVENVFLNSPAAGSWLVEVLGDEVVQDSHTETAVVDADYGLVIAGVDPNAAPACTEPPLPAYTSTYTNSGHTRGTWFTAPVDFEICALQVPDETGHGRQNVEVVRFDAGVTPPTYSSTTSAFTSLFRSVGLSSSNTISTSIQVRAGDVIGILGACGDASTMRNSYGASPFTTNIAGVPVTMRRLGMQFNLASNVAQSVFTSGGSNGRVRFWYRSGSEMAVAPFGSTFSTAALTRGFWFTCPTDASIRSLRVPDESGHGLQNVEVVRFGAAPPLWSSTTNAFTSLYRNVGAPSGQALMVDIPLNAGDIIGILGACGDASTMRNSYGAGPWSTSILGNPVTLTRMGMQSNIVASPTANIWSQSSGSIGRVIVEFAAR